MELKMKRRAIGVFFACAAAAWAAGSGFGGDAQTQQAVAAGNPHSFELRPDHAQVAAGGSVAIDVLANDSAIDDALVLMSVSQPNQGSVQVIDGAPVYTAPANAQGSVVFQYRAKPRHGGPPRYGQVTVDIGSLVSIRGQIVRAAGQTGAVTVELRVGAQTQSTVATEDGRYALDFFAFDDAAIAVLEARGAAGDRPGLHLQSYLGSVGRIRRLAGGDAVLERNESNAVTVSFLSTAQLVHASAADGGLPTSDLAFETAVLGSDQTSMLWMADFMKVVDTGEYALPADTDVLAYVSEPGRITREWSSDAGVDYPEAALDARQTVPVQADAYDGKLVLVDQAVERVTVDGIRSVSIHDVDASGHHFVDGYARPTVALQAGHDEEGQATFTPQADFLLREGPVRVSRFGTLKQLRYLLERKWVKLFDGDRGDQIFQQDTVRLVYPDRPQLNRTTVQYTMWAAYEQLPNLPYTRDEVIGRLTLNVYCPRADLVSGFGFCDYQVHTFNAAGNGGIDAMGASLDGAGQPQAQPVGETFLWALTNAGAISTRRGAIETTYTRISHENAAASGVIAESQIEVNGEVRRMAHYQASVRLPASAPTIAAGDLAGHWVLGSMQHAPLDLFSMTAWTLDFNIDGNGSEKVYDASPWNHNDNRFAWSTDSDAVMLRKYLVDPYYDGDQLVVSHGYCDSEDGQCPVRFQHWKPLAAADGAYYFIEEMYESNGFPSLPLTRTTMGPISLHRN
ncbi:Ig-like domain-containing protein [Lysobacter tyrosinilyticus]